MFTVSQKEIIIKLLDFHLDLFYFMEPNMLQSELQDILNKMNKDLKDEKSAKVANDP